MILVGTSAIEVVLRGKQQHVAHLGNTGERLVIQVRFLDDKLAVVDGDITEVGGYIDQTWCEGHIVDGLAGGQHGILDFGHVDDAAVALDDIDIGVGVDDDQIILVAVVVDLGNHHVAQVVDATQGLVLLRVFVQPEQVGPRQIIDPLVTLGYRADFVADERGVYVPIPDSMLCRSAQSEHCH